MKKIILIGLTIILSGLFIFGCSPFRNIDDQAREIKASDIIDCGKNSPNLEKCFKNALATCSLSKGLLDTDNHYQELIIRGQTRGKGIVEITTNNNDITGKDDSKIYEVHCEYPIEILNKAIVGDDYFSVDNEYCSLE